MDEMYGKQNLGEKIIYDYTKSDNSKYLFPFLKREEKAEMIELIVSYTEKIPEDISLPRQFQVRAHRIHNLSGCFNIISPLLERYLDIPKELSICEKLHILKNDHTAAVVASTLMTTEFMLQKLDSKNQLMNFSKLPVRKGDSYTNTLVEDAKRQLKYLEEIIGTTNTEVTVRAQQSILYFLSFLKTDPETEIIFTRKQDNMCEINIGKAKDSIYSPHCIIDEESSFNSEDGRIIEESILSIFDFENYNAFREGIILPIYAYTDLNPNAKLLNILFSIKNFSYPYPIGEEFAFTKLIMATVMDELELSSDILDTIIQMVSEVELLNHTYATVPIYSTLGAAAQHLYVEHGTPVTFQNYGKVKLETSKTPEGLLIPTIKAPLKYIFDKDFSRFLDVTQMRNDW
jgi:hypothetical protein